MLNFFAFACVGMAVVQASADAGTYYCTPAGAGAHNGTSAANAWSLSEAISRAVAGDVVLLQSGSYGHFNYTRSNADWITWRENIGQTAVFADGATFGGYSSTAAFRCRFEGITFRSNTVSSASGGIRRNAVWMTGGKADSVAGPGYLQFLNCEFINDTKADCFYANNTHHIDIKGCKFDSSYPTADGWTGVGIAIRQSTKAADIVTDINITSCNISEFYQGMSICGVGVLVQGNDVHDCISDGVVFHNGVKNGQIVDNHLHNFYNKPGGTIHTDCIQWQQAGGTQGLDPDTLSTIPWDSILVARNIMHDSEHQGFHAGGLSPAPSNVRVENNLIYNTGSWDFEFQEMASIRFAHNTCVGKPIRFFDAANFEILNNVVRWVSIAGASNGTGTGNVYLSWNSGAGPAGNTRLSDAAFTAMFADWANRNYRLVSTAPAVDLSAIIAPMTDMDGKGRFDVAGVGKAGTSYADAGCYEYGGTTGNQAPVLAAVGNRQAEVDLKLTLQVSASDADGDPMTYTADGLPTGATFSGQTFTWTPASSQSGSHQVTFTVSDGRAQDSETVTITVGTSNAAPVLAAIGNKSVNENSLLTFSISATDTNGDTITYSAGNVPSGAKLTGQAFSWTPTYSQAGAYNVTFTASDGQSQDSETITIAVVNVNRPPVLAAIADKSVNQSSTLNFAISATDPDGDGLTYSAGTLPSGAKLTGQTFTWTPTSTQAGSYQITFLASDGQAQDSQTITVAVIKPNSAPVLAAIGNKSVNENASLTFSITATDPDGNILTYSATNLPSGAGLTGQTFSWTPTYSQAGAYNVTFRASDGQAQDSETITISVANINRPPVLAVIGAKSVDEASPLSFTISATDPDADGLTYSAGTLPSGARLTGQTFTWTPVFSQVGSHQIAFTASDGTLADSETVTVTVVALKDEIAPVVAQQSPAPDAIQVSLNNLVTLHVTDARSGVDANTVTIAVDGNVVYQGNTETHTSSYGRCSRSGTKNDYRFIYQPDEAFDFDQTVAVRVDAADLAHNTMGQSAYSFLTEMRAFGKNRPVSASGEQAAGRPVTVRDAVGNVWVAWHAGPQNARDIYAAKLAAGLDSFGPPIRLTTDGADQCNPDIAVSSDCCVYVVWQDNRNGNWDIYAAACLDGAVFAKEVRVTDSKGHETDPAVAIDGRSPNNAYVAWTDNRNGNQDIYVARSANAFATSTVSRVTTDTADQTEPDVAITANNTAYLVWTDMRNGQADLFCGTASNSGWSNVPTVTGAGSQTQPALAASPDGSTLHLLWVDDAGGGRDIYYAALNGLPNSPVVGASIVDDTTGANQTAPAIVCDGDKVFACWTDSRYASNIAPDTDLYVAELRSGTAKTNIFVGDDGTNSNQSEPAIGMDRFGQPYVVWTDSRSSLTEVYYAGTTFIDPNPLDSELVLASTGATLGTEPAAIDGPDDISLVVPPTACQADIRMTIAKVLNPQVSPPALLGSYDFGPSGVSFDQPVTVTIPYQYSGGNSALPYWYDAVTGALSQQGITDIENISISSELSALRFRTTHFTPFYLVAADDSADRGSVPGGCSISATGTASPAELLVPYAAIAITMVILRRRDRARLLRDPEQ